LVKSPTKGLNVLKIPFREVTPVTNKKEIWKQKSLGDSQSRENENHRGHIATVADNATATILAA